MGNSAKFEKRIAVIGCGNMGAALIEGFCRSLVSEPSQIHILDSSFEKAQALASRLGVVAERSLVNLVSAADIIVLAVKPAGISAVAAEITAALSEQSSKPLVISVAASTSCAVIRQDLPNDFPLVRVMPNVAALVGAGMSVIYAEDAADGETARLMFDTVGKSEILQDEDGIEIATALSGSGPGFLFEIVDAMAEGAVLEGMSSEKAYALAAQTLLGAGVLLSQSSESPMDLCEKVTSPGGTTAAGRTVMVENNLRATLHQVIAAATKRARGKN